MKNLKKMTIKQGNAGDKHMSWLILTKKVHLVGLGEVRFRF